VVQRCIYNFRSSFHVQHLALFGYSSPRSDGYRTFEPEVMLPFLCLRERGDQELPSPAMVEEFCLLRRAPGPLRRGRCSGVR
jgi:hypothetical protein